MDIIGLILSIVTAAIFSELSDELGMDLWSGWSCNIGFVIALILSIFFAVIIVKKNIDDFDDFDDISPA
jgi:ABC-type Fe3+-siderophore transport system permease subunit